MLKKLERRSPNIIQCSFQMVSITKTDLKTHREESYLGIYNIPPTKATQALTANPLLHPPSLNIPSNISASVSVVYFLRFCTSFDNESCNEGSLVITTQVDSRSSCSERRVKFEEPINVIIGFVVPGGVIQIPLAW
jgi:hypothetical protein